MLETRVQGFQPGPAWVDRDRFFSLERVWGFEGDYASRIRRGQCAGRRNHGDRSMLLQAQPSVSFGTGGMSSKLVISLNDATQYQQMDGFGGSLTDSSAWLIWNKLGASRPRFCPPEPRWIDLPAC